MPLKLVPLTLLLLFPDVWFQEPEPVRHLVANTLANVVYVRAGDQSGTAFLMRYRDVNYLVTARHVVDGHLEDPTVPLDFVIGGSRGRPIKSVRLVEEDRRSDIAIYAYEDDPRLPYFPAGAGLVPHGEIHLGSQVFLVGYPASLKQTYGFSQLRVVGGWVAGMKKYVPGSTVEYVDVDMHGVEHGHSGGPILLLQDRVVAVAVQRHSGSISDTIRATYAVPIKYVTALIDGEPVEEDVGALNETLRGTVLVCGLALHGKADYDVWAQRVHAASGESLWGNTGIYVAGSSASESSYLTVPSEGGSTLVVHTAVYTDDGNADIHVQRITKFGELAFENGQRSRAVAVAAVTESRPMAITDGTQGAIVVYEFRDTDGDIDVKAQRISPRGERLWPTGGVTVAGSPLREMNPRLASDGAGGAIVVFEVLQPNGTTDVRAGRLTSEGKLAWQGGAGLVDVAATSRVESHAHAVSDGKGGAIVAYEAETADARRELRVQRVSPHGELGWQDQGQGVVVCALPLTESAGRLAVLADGMGGVFIAAEVLASPQRPEDVDIALQRVGPGGDLLWGDAPDDGVRAPVFAGHSEFAERRPALGDDGQGGVIVIFESGSLQGDLDVWAQRVDADGRPRWNEGKRSSAVSTTFLTERAPRIVERLQDRVLCVFEVERDPLGYGVACQVLSVQTGRAQLGEGRVPIVLMNPGDKTSYMLEAR